DNASQTGKYVAGYMSFEASYAFFNMENKVEFNKNKPLLWFGVFDKSIPLREQSKDTYSISDWKCYTDKETYLHDIYHILSQIKKETFSQINYTAKWHTSFHGDPFANMLN